ncbi:MAG: ParA family protein [Hyphomicrobiaceae bacterium]
MHIRAERHDCTPAFPQMQSSAFLQQGILANAHLHATGLAGLQECACDVHMPAIPRIITIASSKGGVGKSTVAIAIAGALAKRGRRVHIIDLDENETVGRWARQHQIAISGLSVSTAAPAAFNEHLRDVAAHDLDVILVDVAGVYEKALTHAMGRSSLVVVPAQPSEPDIHEATKLIRDLNDLNDTFGGTVPYRLLLNLFDPLDPHYQRHIVDEINRLGLQRFQTVVHKRAPYREAFMNGLPPHYAEAREAVAKAVVEIDALVSEIDALVSEIEALAIGNGALAA